jgi:hypothetical protein
MKRTSKLTKEMTLNSQDELNLTDNECIAIYTELYSNPFPLNELTITKSDISALKKLGTELKKFKNYRYDFSPKIHELIHEINMNILYTPIGEFLSDETKAIWGTELLEGVLVHMIEAATNPRTEINAIPAYHMNEIIETLRNN